MDWVRTKSGGKKKRSKGLEGASLEASGSASASLWLEELCKENIALLQKSVPLPDPTRPKRKKGALSLLFSRRFGGAYPLYKSKIARRSKS